MKYLICSLLVSLLLVPLAWSQTRAIRPVSIQIPNEGEVQLYEGSYALVIGVSDYQNNAWVDLDSVGADVKAVRETLEEQGFAVETLMNPTESMLRDQFEDFIDAYGYEPENRLLFYYAGHGHTQERNERQFGYLVPADAPDPYSNKRAFSRKALKMEQIRSWARQIESKHALFVFDSCFSGSVFQSRAALVPEHISFSTTKPVRQFIAAGTADQTVPAESVFRPLFIRGINGKADYDEDGYVTGVELGMYLQKEVPQYKTGQTPQYGKIRDPYLDEGNFVFEAGSKDSGTPQAKTATLYIGENDLGQSADPKKWRLAGEPTVNHVYTGEVKDGIPNGQGLIRLLDGLSYSGNFKKGFPDGQGVFKYHDGRRYVGSVKKGFPDGQGTYIWTDGSIYIGDFKAGKKRGEGTYNYSNGERYVGGWKDNQKHGQGSYTWPDGSKYVGSFNDGRRDGKGTYTAADGSAQSGIWKEGKFLRETQPTGSEENQTDAVFQQEVHYELGMLFARQNEPKLALEQLLPLRSQERYRQKPGFWTMLVQQYDAMGNTPNAEQMLRDAYNNESFQRNTQLRFLQELANRQYNEKRCLELLSELAPISDPPSTSEAKRLIWQRGSCFLQEKQWGLARTDFETLLEDPDYQESSFRGMLVANQQMQDTSAQLDLFEWASNQSPLLLQDQDWQTWVETLRTEDNWVGLQKAYVKWDQQPESPVRKTLNHLLQWADAERRVENRQTETALLEQALYLLPDNAEPPREQLVRRLSEIYLASKKPQKIPPLYKIHLLALLPENTLLYRNYALQLGEVLAIDLQQLEHALSWLTEADTGSDTPNDLRAAVLRASIYQKTGQPLLALPIWKRLAQQDQDTKLRLLAKQSLNSLKNAEETEISELHQSVAKLERDQKRILLDRVTQDLTVPTPQESSLSPTVKVENLSNDPIFGFVVKEENSQNESPIVARAGTNLLQNNRKLTSIISAGAQLPTKAPPVVLLPEKTEANLLNLMEETQTVPIGQPWLNHYKKPPQSNEKKGACGLPPGLNEKKQFAFAQKMIADGMLSSARDYLLCYRASKPQGEFRNVAMKLEAEVLLQMGESYWPYAQVLFEAWLQENPNDSEGDFARHQLGKIHFRFDRPQVAEETLSVITTTSKYYGSARSLMGQALFQRMLRYQEKGATAQANDLAPRIAKYHQDALQHSLTEKESQISNYQIGFALDISGDSKNALPYYERWIELANPSEEKKEIQKRVRAIRKKLN